jgi:flagellar M-ring protein FliF
MNALLQSLKALGPLRVAALAIVAIGTFGFLIAISMRTPHDRMALLYADLDMREVARMTEELDRQHIPNEVKGDNQVFVSADAVTQARVLLAKSGLPSGGSIGYEIFDRGDGFAANQFQQRIAQLRALEGELGRTIRAINGVRAARVHLVLPTREPFSRSQQEAQASVLITASGANRLDRESVLAITSLVAAAVPGLRPASISVIDSNGTLLSRAQDQQEGSARAESLLQLRTQMEARTAHAVEAMLESSLGPGRVRVQAAIELDYDQVHEQVEKFDPDGQVVRSTQTTTDSSKSTEGSNNVSVQNNLPNADAANAANGTQDQKQEETSNYEIGKTVRTVTHDQPQVKRITVAVLVDGTAARGAEGVVAWKERTPEELDRIGRLVKSSIGFDDKRGDQVDVVNMQFVRDEDGAPAPPATLLGLGLDRNDLFALVRPVVIGLIGLLALTFVLRPMVFRLTALPGAGTAGLLPGDAGGDPYAMGGRLDHSGLAAGMLDAPGRAGAMAAARQIQGGSPDDLALLTDDSMINVANIDGQLRASAIRRIAQLVDKHPDETLSIVRSWMQEGAG